MLSRRLTWRARAERRFPSPRAVALGAALVLALITYPIAVKVWGFKGPNTGDDDDLLDELAEPVKPAPAEDAL